MNKCKACGKEFDGKFCPECGTKNEQWQHCPECGAEVVPNSKYCVECGYSFAAVNSNQRDNKPTNTPKTKTTSKMRVWLENSKHIVFKTLKMTAWILPTLFAVLLFLFYLAPVANLIGDLDENLKPVMESIGNIYTLCGNTEYGGLAAFAIAIIIITTLVLAYAVIHTLIFFRSQKLPKYIGKFSQTFLFSCGTVLIYLLFLIISSVLLGQINSADGGMGIIEASACPKLLLSFSIVFLVLHAAIGGVEIYLVRKYPQLLAIGQSEECFNVEDYIAQANKQYGEHAYKRAADCAEKQRIRYLNKTAKYKDLPISQKNDMTEQEQLATLRKISKLVKLTAVCTFFMFTIFILPCAIFGLLFLLKSKWRWNPRKIKANTYKIIAMIVLSAPICVACCYGWNRICEYISSKNRTFAFDDNGILILMYINNGLHEFESFLRVASYLSISVYCATFGISVIELIQIKKLTVIFYGTKKLIDCNTIKMEMGDLYQAQKSNVFKKIDTNMKAKQEKIKLKYSLS